MRAILPGRPQTELQAVSVGLWEGKRIVVYASGTAIVILDGPNSVLQTTYNDEDDASELVAVAFDESTGKIAAASKERIYVYQPYGQQVGAVRWSLQHTLQLENLADRVRTLSWGADEELLVGSASLTLFATHGVAELQWSRELASPVKFAIFSPDAAYIATTSTYSRLVKIWHRLSYSAEQKFHYAYLPHPATVTGIRWRNPWHREQAVDNVLYTICADNKVRVWAPEHEQRPGSPGFGGGFHGAGSGDVMKLWAEIDLVESIQPRHLATPDQISKKRFACIIDSREFSVAAEKGVLAAGDDPTEEEKVALAHLVEVANRSPEVIVALDDRGNMSAWGLESIGCKTRKTSDVFCIAHVEGLQMDFSRDPVVFEDHVQFYPISGGDEGFSILVHHFDGRLQWYEGRMNHLFDPAPRKERLRRKALFTGHSKPIKKVIRTVSGRALISRTEDGECIIWVQKRSSEGMSISRHCRLNTAEHIHRMWLLQEGHFVVFLHHESISLWDTRKSIAVEIARCAYKVRGKPLCLILIPEIETNEGIVHLATISSEMKGIAWEIQLPSKNQKSNKQDSFKPSLKEFSNFDIGSGEDLAFVLPVDPAGTASGISGFLDTFARDIAISYTHSGQLKSWTARIDYETGKLEWLNTSTIETGIDRPFLASGTSIRKAALVDADKTSLTIWDMRGAQLEYEEKFDSAIQDLDWSATPDNQSVLCVGFTHKVILYTQLRYDYLDQGPSWAAIREINIRDITAHVIGDSVWMSGGYLAIGAGNQIFIQDNQVDASKPIISDLRLSAKKNAGFHMFEVVRTLNGPLPVYHPQFVSQCILAGKLPLVHRILVALYQKLKFFADGDELDSLLGLTIDDFSEEQSIYVRSARKELESSYAEFTESSDLQSISEEIASSLNELLTQRTVPALTSHEQFRLADIIECVGTSEKHRRSLDENGCRFLLFFRQHVLLASQKAESMSPISWREIIWAYHSGSQDILVDLTSRHWGGKMGWKQAKDTGMFMWMTDLTALRAQFEVIARNEYTKGEDKNPVDCSLYYLALKKKAVLLGLWRMAGWNKEQAGTLRLLQNNFQESRWKTAALKNAYALMGKRRFQYAAAFFLLADHLKDAVSVLAGQLQDLQLAITVARVYEGDDGPVLKEFLENKVLPLAAEDGNRWLATWAFWMLKKRDKAVRALITPLTNLISPTSTPTQTLLYTSVDPALVVLYKQLRAKSLQTLKGALRVQPRAEWDFVIYIARLYSRMGCDILALDLVRDWEFLLITNAPPPKAVETLAPLPTSFPGHSTLQSPTLAHHAHAPSMLDSFDINPKKLLRRRSSLVVDDLPATRNDLRAGLKNGEHKQNDHAITEDGKGENDGKKAAEKKKPPPTMFNEPDANSLLDAFGF